MTILWAASEGFVFPEEQKRELERTGGFQMRAVNGPLPALEELGINGADAILAEFPIAGWTAEEWLEEAQRVNSLTPVVIRQQGATLEDAVRLTKLGAYSVFDEEAPLADLGRAIEDAIEHKRSREPALLGMAGAAEPWKQFLVGESRPMKSIGQIIRLVGPRRSTVLITGETGTGKEMLARAIHVASGRGRLPMVAVNCNALPETLLEAELFGHVRGAFTGAINHRIGRFEQANHSTLFLDEIGDMPLDLQAKLLRVLQEREVQRVGSSEVIHLDVRVVAASNTDLQERIRDGRFREDLFYRLNVVPVHMPPLRERPDDIPLLVHHFVEKICRQEEMPGKQISREALDRLCDYPWPGNVRQLENAVEMAIALSGDKRELQPADFSLPGGVHRKPAPSSADAATVVRVPEDGLDFERTVSRIERSILCQALERTRGNKKLAAEMLRLKRTTLSAKLKSLDLASA